MKSIFLLIASFMSGFHYALAGNPQELEQQVKAVCMYNFAKFIDWPISALPADATEINICVVGEAPLAGILEAKNDLIAKQKNILVKRLPSKADASAAESCHLLYWNNTITTLSTSLSQSLLSKPIVSVTEHTEKSSPALIEFHLVDDRVKFTIDHERAKALGVMMSPQLLRLALRK